MGAAREPGLLSTLFTRPARLSAEVVRPFPMRPSSLSAWRTALALLGLWAASGVGAAPVKADDPALPAPEPATGPETGPETGERTPPADPTPGTADAPSVLTDLRVGLSFQDRLQRSLPAEGVLRVFEQLQRSNPENVLLRFLVARARATRAASAEMRAALGLRLGLPTSERAQVATGWFVLSRLEAELGLFKEALESAGYALRLEPNEPTFALLGWIHQRRGDAGQAVAAYTAGLRLDPRALPSRLALADLLVREGKVAEALPLARGTLVLHPRSALAHLTWGTALALAGSVQDARRAYQRALRLADGDPSQVASVAAALRRIDGQALAYESLLAAHAAHATHRAVLLQLVGLEIETGRHAQAARRLDEALAGQPADPQLWFLRGMAFDAQRRPREAAGAYAKAAKVDGEALEYRLAQAGALQRAADGKQALAVYRTTAQRFPQSVRARELFARSLLEQREFTEAALEFEAVAAANPDDPNPCYFVAVVRGAHLGQMGEARVWLDRYVARGGTEPAALRWREDLRRALGK